MSSSTRLTFAGMIAGFSLLAKTYPEDGERLGRRKITGIDASATPVETGSRVLRTAKATVETIGLGAGEIEDDGVILDEKDHAGTYGIPDKQTIEAIRYVCLESLSKSSSAFKEVPYHKSDFYTCSHGARMHIQSGIQSLKSRWNDKCGEKRRNSRFG